MQITHFENKKFIIEHDMVGNWYTDGGKGCILFNKNVTIDAYVIGWGRDVLTLARGTWIRRGTEYEGKVVLVRFNEDHLLVKFNDGTEVTLGK